MTADKKKNFELQSLLDSEEIPASKMRLAADAPGNSEVKIKLTLSWILTYIYPSY